MKLALIGSGKIIMSALDALSHVQGIDVVALCVREASIEKGKLIFNQFKINKLYTHYKELLQDPDIEVVYIGLPNHLHYNYTFDALMANKHVICEKPFTAEWEQLQELILLSHERGLYLFEAITSIHTPGFNFIKQNINKIGDIKIIQANYSQYSSRYDDYIRGNVHAAFDPQQAGGALYDINLYNIYILSALIGESEQSHYICNKGYNGIDTSGILTLKFGSIIAVCTGAKDSDSLGYFTIQGTKGYVKVEGSPGICQSVEVCIDGKVSSFTQEKSTNHMTFEFEFFRDQIASKKLEVCYELLELAVMVSKLLSKSRNDAGINFK